VRIKDVDYHLKAARALSARIDALSARYHMQLGALSKLCPVRVGDEILVRPSTVEVFGVRVPPREMLVLQVAARIADETGVFWELRGHAILPSGRVSRRGMFATCTSNGEVFA
jgi:hypothetical protein